MRPASRFLAAASIAPLLATVLLAGSDAQAQRFPARPIELIVPFSPGGGSGITAEVMKKIIADEKLSPQPISITYKPGASGQVGWTHLATRKGNAHVIATATQSFSYGFVNKQMQVAPEDFTPIALMLIDTQLIASHPASGLKSMNDLIEASRRKPGSIRVGGTGASGSDANVALMIQNAVKIKLNYIPFKSGGDVNAAILGGHLDAALGNPNELAGYVEAGKLTALAVFSDERVAGLKDVPTMKELGHNVVSRSARGVVAPAGIARQEEQVLVEMMRRITESKQWAEYAAKNMMSVRFLGGADYGKYLAEERASLAALLQSIAGRERARTAEAALALVIAALGAAMLVTAWGMAYLVDGVPGPGFLPRWIAAGVLISGTMLLLRALRPAAIEAGAPPWPSTRGWARIGAMMAALAIALLLLKPLGFVLVAALFMATMVACLGDRRWGMLVAAPLLSAVALYLVFAVWLGVPLPKGLLEALG